MNKYDPLFCKTLTHIIEQGKIYIDNAIEKVILKHDIEFKSELEINHSSCSQTVKSLTSELYVLKELEKIRKGDGFTHLPWIKTPVFDDSLRYLPYGSSPAYNTLWQSRCIDQSNY